LEVGKDFFFFFFFFFFFSKSHLTPLVLFVHLLVQVYSDPLKMREDHVVFAAYLASCCLLCSFSSIYHIFSCHSERVHDVVVRLDFVGIIFVIASSFAIALHYGFHCAPFYRNLYMTITVLLDFSMLAFSFLKIDPVKRRLLFLTAVLFSVVPLSHLVYLFGFDHIVFRTVCVLLTLYALAFCFYASRFPGLPKKKKKKKSLGCILSVSCSRNAEKYFPRTFDLFGSSHQIWHLLLDVAFVYFYVAMESVHMQIKYIEC
jgi:adiponectin receptor